MINILQILNYFPFKPEKILKIVLNEFYQPLFDSSNVKTREILGLC